MTEPFNRAEHCREAGRVGGKSNTEQKKDASRFNLAKAREVKDFYRRHPEARPERQPQQSSKDGQQ